MKHILSLLWLSAVFQFWNSYTLHLNKMYISSKYAGNNHIIAFRFGIEEQLHLCTTALPFTLCVSVWCASQFSARHFKCTIRELFSLDVVKISNELKKTKKPTFSPSEAELLSFFKLLSHSKDLFSWTDLIFFYWILNEFVLRCGYLSEIIWNAGFLFKP